MAWYSEPEVWSAAASVVAIGLSQLPPVRLWFKRSRVSIMLRNQAALKASVNGPVVQFVMRVENSGGKPVRVDRISMGVKRDGQNIMELDAQGYFETFTAQAAVMFHPFRLNPDTDWTHTVNFFPALSRDDDRAYRREKSALTADIHAKAATRLPGSTDLVYADESVYAPLKRRFDRNFIWDQGDYELTISVWVKGSVVVSQERYRFVIFESDRDELAAAGKKMAYGEGVMFEPKEYAGLLIALAPA